MIDIKKIILLLSIFLLCSCTKYHDLNNLNIITDIAIDNDTMYLKEFYKESNNDITDYKYNIHKRKFTKNIDDNFYLYKLKTIVISDKSILKDLMYLKKYNENIKIYLAKNPYTILKAYDNPTYLYNIQKDNKNTIKYLTNNNSINTYLLVKKNKKLSKKKVMLSIR